ncbi:unnamed protein product [Cuscuta campestris]|uniref:Alpha-ketoglutarate-dependent dioxygenase AlkB-like domain-containing protein n=1 Tax=Cuscuta campestris TaxID=132261 RepID=A0A484N8C3_9ASTE|nr:unnamed protein product [Cuscuta campestris]
MGSNQAESSNFCCDSKRGSSVGNAGGVAERVLNQPLVEIAKMNAKKTDHTGDDCASKYATGENIEMEELADSQPPDDSSFFEDLSVKENPFSLILPRDVSSVCETEMHHGTENLESSYELLQSGMVLLQNYVGISDQVEIVKACEALGGFYQPGYRNGGKLKLHMMCLGRAWDPQTRYNKIDGSRAPPAIPDKLTSFVKRALQDSQESKDELPSMSPDICIVNFYSTAGGLGLHQVT